MASIDFCADLKYACLFRKQDFHSTLAALQYRVGTGSEHSARAMDDYHLFWMLSFLGGQLCALRSTGSEKCMAVFERRLSGEAGLSGLLFNTAYDKYQTGNHRKLYMGCCNVLFISG